mgnify:CR=1 FL=1
MYLSIQRDLESQTEVCYECLIKNLKNLKSTKISHIKKACDICNKKPKY